MNKLFSSFTAESAPATEKAPRFIRPWAQREALVSTGMAETEADNVVIAQYVPDAETLSALFLAAGLVFARPAYKATSPKSGTVYTTGIAFRANVRRLAPFAIKAALERKLPAEGVEREVVSLLDCMLGGTAEGRERFASVLGEVRADSAKAAAELAALNESYKATHDKGRK